MEKYRWLVAFRQDAEPWEVHPFVDEQEARTLERELSKNWSNVYLARIVGGPADEVEPEIQPADVFITPVTTVIDPRQLWCEKNLDKLRAIPHSYAAIVMPQGMVASASEISELRIKLRAEKIDPRATLIVRTDDYL